MLASDEVDTAQSMLITVITQSACVCVKRDTVIEKARENVTSLFSSRQPPHYFCKGLSLCCVGSLSLEHTRGWMTPPTASTRKNDMAPLVLQLQGGT